jgi:choline dehydrogenase-like flavoprotein
MGLHPLTTARGIASRNYQGRSGCAYCSLCGSYGCEVDAKSGTHVTVIPRALATGKVDLRPRAMAKKIEVDAKGNAKSVVYIDAKGQEQEQPTRAVVVSCSAIESARLLLNSTSTQYPKGLANNSGNVGKHLHFSTFVESRAHFRISRREKEWPWLSSSAPFVLRTIQDFYVAKNQPFKKAGTLDFVWAHPNPIFAIQHIAGETHANVFGKALKDKMREYADSKILQSECYAEYLPNPKTWMDVDPGTLDKYGIPAARIQAVHHPHDVLMGRWLADRGEEILKAMKPDKLERRADDGVTTILQGGTCRAGHDPETSVLDKDCRSHEVKNLWVVDGSFLPSSGGVTPTLTILANAFRVGHSMIDTLKKA